MKHEDHEPERDELDEEELDEEELDEEELDEEELDEEELDEEELDEEELDEEELDEEELDEEELDEEELDEEELDEEELDEEELDEEELDEEELDEEELDEEELDEEELDEEELDEEELDEEEQDEEEQDEEQDEEAQGGEDSAEKGSEESGDDEQAVFRMDDYGLEDFKNPSDDQGLSLEELSEAYAQVAMDAGDDPYEQRPSRDEKNELVSLIDEDEVEEAEEEDTFEVTPLGILEAILFVGTPDNLPLGSRTIASLMRGVRPVEVDDLVTELNERYESAGTPYTIVPEESGYRMVLRKEYSGLRNKFYGRVKDARLSQAAIEILAVVAYRQPMTREQIDKLRKKPCGGVLSQMVRRELLSVEHTEKKPRKKLYRTTERFLKVFGLERLEDLPQSQEALHVSENETTGDS